MKRPSALSVAVLLAALLSACGTVGTTVAAPGAGVQAQPGRVQSAAISPSVSPSFPAIRVVAAVLEVGGRSVVTASLNFSAGPGAGLTAQAISVNVESAPPGVSVRLLSMSSGTDALSTVSDLTLPVEVRADDAAGATGPGAAQGEIWLNVRQGAQSLRVRLPEIGRAHV